MLFMYRIKCVPQNTLNLQILGDNEPNYGKSEKQASHYYFTCILVLNGLSLSGMLGHVGIIISLYV